jgi:Flp pilus assembly pilin Flp
VLVALNFGAERAFFMGRIDSVEKFLRCETGLELSEYAVAAALVTALTVIAFAALGNVIVDRINTLAGYIP